MPQRDPHDIDPALAEAVRRTYVRPVDDVRAARHVAQISGAAEAAAEARTPRAAARPLPRARLRAWRPVLAAGLAVLLLPAGLAVAGVGLPESVEAPYDAVGIHLPNQRAELEDRRETRDDDRDRPPRTTPAVVPPVTTPADAPAVRSTPSTSAARRAERARRREAERGRGDERRRDDPPAVTGAGRPDDTPADRGRDDPPRSDNSGRGRSSAGETPTDRARSGSQRGSRQRQQRQRQQRQRQQRQRGRDGGQAPQNGSQGGANRDDQTSPPRAGTQGAPEQDAGTAPDPSGDDADRGRQGSE